MVDRQDTGIGVVELTAALKRCLRSRNMTYASLAHELELSEASVKRLFSERSFTLKRIEAICTVLGIDFFELARLARGPDAGPSRLTVEQERGLAADPKLLLAFHLLLNEWSGKDVTRSYAVSAREWARIAAALERLGLVEVQRGGALRLKTSTRIVWHADGPVRRAYQKLILAEFFEHPFGGARAALEFESKELSAASIDLVRRRIERLVQEFNDLAELDSSLEPRSRTSVGMVVALRTYVLSLFTRYRRSGRRRAGTL